ncbi:hypothetical protein DPMN_132654 [Dreissena polymorpha]|uniref:CCHC-type domain-containing protein n=1 Tax=Dreissena polymorpha TaxID=45954 RepID=A0A9D4FSW4_DREPO|nr:hypothetical protein DPMN_132654 [Dreissena polymorpha]
MSDYTRMFGPLKGNAIDKRWMERTLKIQGQRGATMVAVIGLLKSHGLTDRDIDALASGPPGSLSYDVVFNDKDKLMSFMEDVPSAGVAYEGIKYFFSSYGKQFVDIRVHWLPVFIDNRVLSEMFEQFGKVISIKNEIMDMEDFHVMSGVRIVRMQMDEEAKNAIPHLLSFACGTRALLTVRGRQPLCLKCLRLGHVRGSCPNNNSGQRKDTSSKEEGSQEGSWASVVGRKAKKSVTDDVSRPDRAGGSTESVNPQTGGGEGVPKRSKKTKTVFEGAPIEAETLSGEMPGEELESVVSVTDDGAHHEMDTNIQGTKRSIDDDFTPMPKNRPASGPVSSPEDPFEGMFTQDSVKDGLLASQSPHHNAIV